MGEGEEAKTSTTLNEMGTRIRTGPVYGLLRSMQTSACSLRRTFGPWGDAPVGNANLHREAGLRASKEPICSLDWNPVPCPGYYIRKNS